MKSATKDIGLGGGIAILVAGLIIFAFEYDKSIWQILLGFILFIIPFTFISSFSSNAGSFIFLFSLIMITYFVSTLYLVDFWIGVLLAAIISGALFYFRVHRYTPFNPAIYRKKAGLKK